MAGADLESAGNEHASPDTAWKLGARDRQRKRGRLLSLLELRPSHAGAQRPLPASHRDRSRDG